MKKIAVFFLLSVIVITAKSQAIVPLWKDYVEAKKAGKISVLPDFSYAGYHFSEKQIPDVSEKKHFNVVDYGATPDDNQSDEEGIQAAILAAEKNEGGGVVFFPPGKFLLSADTNNRKQIRISKSNIVLKGSGKGLGGTQIHQENMWINKKLIWFSPDNNTTKKTTRITKNAECESFWIEVEDATFLHIGQDVVIRHRSEEYTRYYFSPLELKSQWARLFGENGGMQVAEIHTIEKIENNRVKFKNPLHLDIKMLGKPFELYTYNSIEECGIEDILFTSNWGMYPEEFIHHKNAIHDNAYNIIGMENVKNTWVRNCEFKDWNDGLFLRAAYAVTIANVDFTGKKGHTSIHARTGYGVLIKNCNFNDAQHHGAGTGYSAAGTVITQCTLGKDQNFDIHSGQPYATLFDDIKGGVFYNLGGPEPGHPHHGKYLVLWNFQHSSARDMNYNFWDMQKRRNYTIAKPILVGFRADSKVTFENEGLNVMPGRMVSPKSLFEAQLALRLYGRDISKK